jgi:hypothetical protein
MDQRLVVNDSRFPHETLDGETVLIDAETGHVILLTGFASTLWGHLVEGASLEELVRAVDARFGTEAGAATGSFLQELRAAEIVIATKEVGLAPAAPPPWPDKFTAPALKRFDDIANIIAMDPVHDVDSRGWPHANNSNA